MHVNTDSGVASPIDNLVPLGKFQIIIIIHYSACP